MRKTDVQVMRTGLLLCVAVVMLGASAWAGNVDTSVGGSGLWEGAKAVVSNYGRYISLVLFGGAIQFMRMGEAVMAGTSVVGAITVFKLPEIVESVAALI